MGLLDTEIPGTTREIYNVDADGQTRTHNLWITSPVLKPLSYTAQKLLLGRSWVYPVGVVHHCIFIISHLWLTPNPRSTMVLLDTGILVPVEKFTVRMPMVRHILATSALQTQCSSHWAIQLKSYCWEEVEFIQVVYCIIVHLSFLNCDWLLIREVQWFYWTQELLVPVDKFTLGMPIVKLEFSTTGPQSQCSSHWAIQLKLIAGKELSLSSWCIASLYTYHFSTVIDFSSEKYSGSIGHRNPWYQ